MGTYKCDTFISKVNHFTQYLFSTFPECLEAYGGKIVNLSQGASMKTTTLNTFKWSKFALWIRWRPLVMLTWWWVVCQRCPLRMPRLWPTSPWIWSQLHRKSAHRPLASHSRSLHGLVFLPNYNFEQRSIKHYTNIVTWMISLPWP